MVQDVSLENFFGKWKWDRDWERKILAADEGTRESRKRLACKELLTREGFKQARSN